MKRVRVTRGPVPHGFEYHRNGAEIEMPNAIADVLIKVGRVVEVAVGEESAPRRVYHRRDVQPEHKTVLVTEPPKAAAKPTATRRIPKRDAASE